jgi:hypothetical protein
MRFVPNRLQSQTTVTIATLDKGDDNMAANKLFFT